MIFKEHLTGFSERQLIRGTLGSYFALDRLMESLGLGFFGLLPCAEPSLTITVMIMLEPVVILSFWDPTDGHLSSFPPFRPMRHWTKAPPPGKIGCGAIPTALGGIIHAGLEGVE